MIRSLLLLTLLTTSVVVGTQFPDCNNSEENTNDDHRIKTRHNHETSARSDRFEQFDWDISKELSKVEKGNVVISPFSLKVVLAMLYEGAKGETAQEIKRALQLNHDSHSRFDEIFMTLLQSPTKGEYKIKMGSHLFIDEHAVPKTNYLMKLKQYYNSEIKKVNFQDAASAAKEINNWARNVTEGHIQNLISEAETHSSTIMLLLNAVYFKGLWKIPFPVNQTEVRSFHLNDRGTVSVSMMNTIDKYLYTEIPQLKAEMIKLPYLGDKFSMYVVLPHKVSGLDELISSVGPQNPLSDYIKGMYEMEVNLTMPKFEFDFTTSLRHTLEKLGIVTMFDSRADLTDIAESKNGGLVVSNVLQKAGISVTETGTEAYVATAAELQDKFGGGDELRNFHADHPFLFFIQEEALGTTVFVGKVMNPQKIQVTPANPPESVPTPTAEPTPPACKGTKCSAPSKTDNKGSESQDTKELTIALDRLNFFDADLLREVSLKEKGNFVISPASVKSLLGLLMEGAEGETLKKLLNVLRLPHDMNMAHQVLNRLHNVLQVKTAGITVDSHAGAFVSNRYEINNTYSKSLRTYHRAEVTSEDFSSADNAANNINKWISDRTRGMIPKLIESGMITSDTLAVLVSAIYFDGVWKTQFLERDTRVRCFYPEPTYECQNVSTMALTEDLLYKFDQELDAHILQIPYEDKRFSMVLVVPDRRDGIYQLSLNAGGLKVPHLLRDLKEKEVNLRIPRFSIEHSTNLKAIMEELHLEELFSESAQLPYMIKNKPGKVSTMVHKAKIQVNEKGTKASAASAAGVVPLSYGMNEVSLYVDRPFYYFIYEQESRAVLFSGRLSTMKGAAEKADTFQLKNTQRA